MKFRQFLNKVTGQTITSPAGRYGNFLLSVKKICQYSKYNYDKYYIVHLTLTLAKYQAALPTKEINRVLTFLRTRLKRVEGELKYICVKEIQEERKKKYGEEVIHYHLLCIYNKAYQFPSKDEIAKSWGLGFVKITAPKNLKMKMNSIATYLGKYIGKGYEYSQLEIDKSHTASQIPQIYKLAKDRLQQVWKKYGLYTGERFKCTFTKVWYENVLGERIPILEFQTDWQFMGIVEEAF